MENAENIKDQLVKDLKEIRKKISKLETVQIKNGKIKDELNQNYKKLNKIMEDIVSIITRVAEMRDPYLRGHQKRVSKLATAIAQEMKLARDKIEGIKFAALVHDAGRFNWPIKIVNNEGQLAEEEHELVKNHPRISYFILKTVNFPWHIAEIAYQHHEKLDGSGYPKGLKDDEILMEAKIIAVADVVEAMSSKRSYRPAYSIKEVLEEISKNKGILYESQVVDACLRLFQEKQFQFNEE
jgi:HD-GYP domain-containing protein (c-di-GMP phosphodiesterase class II)